MRDDFTQKTPAIDDTFTVLEAKSFPVSSEASVTPNEGKQFAEIYPSSIEAPIFTPQKANIDTNNCHV